MMTAPHSLNPARLLDAALSGASSDLMGHVLSTVINALLSAEADVVGRHGRPEMDTRAGQSAPGPEDFFDPDTDGSSNIQHVTVQPDRQPF